MKANKRIRPSWKSRRSYAHDIRNGSNTICYFADEADLGGNSKRLWARSQVRLRLRQALQKEWEEDGKAILPLCEDNADSSFFRCFRTEYEVLREKKQPSALERQSTSKSINQKGMSTTLQRFVRSTRWPEIFLDTYGDSSSDRIESWSFLAMQVCGSVLPEYSSLSLETSMGGWFLGSNSFDYVYYVLPMARSQWWGTSDHAKLTEAGGPPKKNFFTFPPPFFPFWKKKALLNSSA